MSSAGLQKLVKLEQPTSGREELDLIISFRPSWLAYAKAQLVVQEIQALDGLPGRK